MRNNELLLTCDFENEVKKYIKRTVRLCEQKKNVKHSFVGRC